MVGPPRPVPNKSKKDLKADLWESKTPTFKSRPAQAQEAGGGAEPREKEPSAESFPNGQRQESWANHGPLNPDEAIPRSIVTQTLNSREKESS